MQEKSQRTHKPVTYGKKSRNTPRSPTNDFSGTSAIHANPTEQQGGSTALPSSSSHDRKQPKGSKRRETESWKTRAPGAQNLGGEEKDDGTVNRKCRKLALNNQRDFTNEHSVDYGTHSVIGFANDTHGTSGKSAGVNTQTRPGRHGRQNKKRGGGHFSRHPPLQSRSDTTQETVCARKKLVDLLGSAHSPTEEFSPVHMNSSELNNGPHSHSTSACRRDLLRQQQTFDPYEARCSNANAMEDSAAVPLSNLRESKVTYARQRSFLNEISISNDTEDQDAKCKGRQITSKMTPDVDMHDDDMNDGVGPVRSIHELRQAGDNARFRSAVDCIFEDISDGRHSTSIRCNGFVQLSSKLLDRQFARRFAEYGFAERLVKYVTSDLDIISASFALCSYEMILLNGAFPHTHLADLWSKLLDLSPKLLDVKDDVLLLSKRRKFGVSKAVQMSIQSNILPLSSAIGDDQPTSILTPCFIVLCCIRTVLLSFQQNNYNNTKIMPTAILDQLVNLLLLVQHPGANLSLSTGDFQIILSVLSILETYTILLGTLPVDHQNTLRPLSKLHHFLDLKESQSNDHSRQTRVLYIRVILNLTNNDSSFCNELVTPDLVGELVKIIISESCAPEGCLAEEKNSINTVILALGTLINLTEKSDLGRAMFLTTTNDSTSFLHLLLRKFSANIGLVTEAHSVHDTYYSVVIGYLSVLIIILCLNMEAYSQVKDFLGSKGLGVALSTADEFQQYHQRVEQDLHASGVRGSTRSDFTAQLQGIICQVRQLEGSL